MFTCFLLKNSSASLINISTLVSRTFGIVQFERKNHDPYNCHVKGMFGKLMKHFRVLPGTLAHFFEPFKALQVAFE